MKTNELKTENEALYRLWLHNLPGIYNYDMRTLLSSYNSAYDLYQLLPNTRPVSLSEDKVSSLYLHRNLDETKALYEKFKKSNVDIIYPGHPNYPDKLLDIQAPPEILYVQGTLAPNISDTHSNIAIVGSRAPDSYGREYAYMFSQKLTAYGINIISGLAKGIDSYAHRGALSSKGYTLAVLGCGINQIYPRENYNLYLEIAQKGAIISEYPPDAKPLSFQFPERNRIISGLSDGVLVVEAKSKSGSLITCNYALEQGKPVFAIPGRISDPLSQGTNSLIYDGAICTTTPEDITDILTNTVTDKADTNTSAYVCMSGDEHRILDTLSLYDTYIDDIVDRARLSVTKTINTLLSLQEKGVVKETSKGYYIKTVIF